MSLPQTKIPGSEDTETGQVFIFNFMKAFIAIKNSHYYGKWGEVGKRHLSNWQGREKFTISIMEKYSRQGKNTRQLYQVQQPKDKKVSSWELETNEQKWSKSLGKKDKNGKVKEHEFENIYWMRGRTCVANLRLVSDPRHLSQLASDCEVQRLFQGEAELLENVQKMDRGYLLFTKRGLQYRNKLLQICEFFRNLPIISMDSLRCKAL